MNNEDVFSVFIPLQIEKSEGEDRYANMKLKGVASTIHSGRDSDGEILMTDGMDIRELTTTSFLNWHHLWTKDPSMIIGEPTKAEIKNGELHIEGKLYSSSQKARDAYDLAEVLETDGSTRRLGWSIEGKVIARDPNDNKKILKSRISGIALTPMPKNKGTKCEIMKGSMLDLFKAEMEGVDEGADFLIDTTDTNGIRRTVDRNFNIKVWGDSELSKAMIAGDITGRDTTDQSLTQEPLKAESVAGVKNKKKKKKDDEHDELAIKSLTKGEAILYLMDEGYDAESSKLLYELACDVSELTKGGEGSKGGKVIGHTKSGKPIYSKFNHPSHKDFSANDHIDAMMAHPNKGHDGEGEKHHKAYGKKIGIDVDRAHDLANA